MDPIIDFAVRVGILVLFSYSVRERWTPLLLISILLTVITYVMSIIDFSEAPVLHTVWLFIASGLLGLSAYAFMYAVRKAFRER